MGDDLKRLLDGLSDDEFEELYGPLARLEPSQGKVLLDGLGAPWWIVGGWAIEAFTGRHRPHDDVDVCVLSRDVPLVIEHFIGTHHLWATGAGMLCPILAVDQALPSWSNQIWLRQRATGPWLLDIIIAPDRQGRWVFRRDPTYDDDLENVTWMAGDGMRYQNPEITLAFKAALDRPKDNVDLEAVLPQLQPEARRWLAETVARLYPGHRWLHLLG